MKNMKQVQVIERHEVERLGLVCYLVQSSDGKDEYCTTVRDGKVESCTCPSYRRCYHMDQVEQKERHLREERRAAYEYTLIA